MSEPSGNGRDAVHIIDHPFARAAMTVLRDRRTNVRSFRETLRRMSLLIAVEALAGVRTRRMDVSTPLARSKGWVLRDAVVLVPVLRAGLGMLEGFYDLCPDAIVGHVGLYRDEETLEPVEYYVNLPKNVADGFVIILDPMLATGGSAVATMQLLRSKGVRNLVLATLIAAPEGIEKVRGEPGDTRIITCAIDRRLNKNGYIVPGLGDAGDRVFGT